MDAQTVSFAAFRAYAATESERWREWFAAAPGEVLDLPLGAGAAGTVRDLVKHIFAVELRYAQRLLGEPVTDYEQLSDDTVEALWRIRETANAAWDRYLAAASAEDLERLLVFETRKLGRLEARAHKVVVHTCLHSIRHWAQIAMLLRQHGHGGIWEHDWLLSPAVE